MFSLVIPVFNEEKLIDELVKRTIAAIETFTGNYEVIFVDDGSTDQSLTKILSWRAKNQKIKLLSLSKNFGHQAAFTAGLEHTSGRIVGMMDGDLQDPPELLPQMIASWKKGYDVVYTVKKSRREAALKRFAFKSFYRVLHSLSAIDIPMDAGNFSLLDRRVVDVLRSMPERNRYISGMRAWAGFQQIAIPYDRGARFAGEPQMSLGRLIRLALDGIFSFSDIPLRMAIYLGLAAAVVSFAGGLFVLYAKLFTDKAIMGWASTIISITFVGGMILLTLGVIGEYISRIYEEVKRRPLYVIRDKVGF
jgi:dolichol-phosphate mannosyltransferase